MRISLLCSPSTSFTADWVRDQLTDRGHQLEELFPTVAGAVAAGQVGHALADRWGTERPDLVLALGWEAGLAAQVGARTHGVPVVLRLARAARGPGSDQDRLETALARSSRRVLLPSVGELDRLVERGLRRANLRVLPEAVDRAAFVDAGAELSDTGRHRVAIMTASAGGRDVAVAAQRGGSYEVVPVAPDATADDLAQTLRSVHAVVVLDDSEPEVALALRAMSCGVPVVAVARGALSDLVADEVTGLLVRSRTDVQGALRRLLADPLRRQSMGLASVDRVRARFDTSVVGAALEGLLVDALPRRVSVPS